MRILLMVFSVLFIPAVIFAIDLPKKEITAKIDSDGVQRVEMVGGSYFFDPHKITVKVNTPVELRVRKEGRLVPHDIVIKAPEAGIDVQEELSTSPKVIKFTPTKPGRYPIFCSKKLPLMESHKEKGMEGELIVE